MAYDVTISTRIDKRVQCSNISTETRPKSALVCRPKRLYLRGPDNRGTCMCVLAGCDRLDKLGNREVTMHVISDVTRNFTSNLG